MTRVVFTENSQHEITGFVSSGHAEYAKKIGQDIVCSGISVLLINTVNSLETIAGAELDVTADEDSGHISLNLRSKPDVRTETILRSAILGLQGISAEYGSQYCQVTVKEGLLC